MSYRGGMTQPLFGAGQCRVRRRPNLTAVPLGVAAHLKDVATAGSDGAGDDASRASFHGRRHVDSREAVGVYLVHGPNLISAV